MNIERLGLVTSPGPDLLGSAYGLGLSELNATRRLFPYDISLGSPDEDVLRFLRNHDVFNVP
jgi:hypothetical protein